MQAQTIFTEEFLSLDGIPEGWSESSLLGIANYLNGLAMQKFRPSDDEQGLPVLKIKELRQGSCDAIVNCAHRPLSQNTLFMMEM